MPLIILQIACVYEGNACHTFKVRFGSRFFNALMIKRPLQHEANKSSDDGQSATNA